jgi:hypothetical protein
MSQSIRAGAGKPPETIPAPMVVLSVLFGLLVVSGAWTTYFVMLDNEAGRAVRH